MATVRNLKKAIREWRPDENQTESQKIVMESARTLLELAATPDAPASLSRGDTRKSVPQPTEPLHACATRLALALARLAGVGAKKVRITMVDRLNPKNNRVFESYGECRQWLYEGLAGTEGAEQEHFSNMLVELTCGETTLHYN